MTLLTLPTRRTRDDPAPHQERGLLLRGVSWETYESLREELDAAGEHFLITYDRETMHVMPPLRYHEWWKGLVGRLVETLAMERRIPIVGAGSTTLKRRDLDKGAEADESYYVQNAAAMIGKRDLDLTVDPPPDLAIEIEATHVPMDKPSIYAALGVNEIWRCDGKRIKTLILDKSGAQPTYRTSEFSAAFPFLRPMDLQPFLDRAYELDDTALLLEFRDWVNTKFRPKKGRKK